MERLILSAACSADAGKRGGEMKVGIVGAGVFGLAAAIELRTRGHAVTVFDRGAPPYENASSTDVSKAIRRTWYAGDNDTYVELVERAALRWREWERRSGESFYHQTGGLGVVDSLGPGDPMYSSAEYLRGRGAELEVLSRAEASVRFPQFNLKNGEVCVYDGWAGYLESGRAVAVMARIARGDGVDLRECTPVEGVDEVGPHAEVGVEDGGRESFDHVIVAAGCWVGSLLPAIGAGVRVTHQEMLFVVPEEPARFARGAFPVWSLDPDGEGWYGFPMLREGYVKVAIDAPGGAVDPDMDRVGTPEFEERALALLRERIPDLAQGRVVGGRSCLYTITPDDHFIVDRAPGYGSVFVAGGGSGHGFKFGASIGPVIADAVEGIPNPLGKRFRIGDRFDGAAPVGEASRGYARPKGS